jgi:hypothetical protein
VTPKAPDGYELRRRMYARLYRAYMVIAYLAFGHLGASFLFHDVAASWVGWFLVVTGVFGVVTMIVRRPRIADLPLWIHAIAFVLGVAMLGT